MLQFISRKSARLVFGVVVKKKAQHVTAQDDADKAAAVIYNGNEVMLLYVFDKVGKRRAVQKRPAV